MVTLSNWNIFRRYWPFVRGIRRSPVSSPHKGQWRRALMFSLICDWTNDWANNRDAGDLRRHGAYYDVTVMHIKQYDVRGREGISVKNRHSSDDIIFTMNWKNPRPHTTNLLFSLELSTIIFVYRQQHPSRNQPLKSTPIWPKTEVCNCSEFRDGINCQQIVFFQSSITFKPYMNHISISN